MQTTETRPDPGDAKPGAMQALRQTMALMSPQRRRQLRLSVALMLIGGLAEVVSIGAVLPFLALLTDPARAEQIPAVGFIFGMMGWTGRDDVMFGAVVLLISTAVFAGAIRLLLTWVSQKFVVDFGHDLGILIYSRLLRQPYSAHVQKNTSEAIAGVDKVQTIVFAVLLPLMQASVAAVVSLCIILLLMTIDPVSATFAALLMGGLYFLISMATSRTLKRNSETLAMSATTRVKLIQEGLGGIRDILIDQSQPVFEDAFRRIDRAYRRAQLINIFAGAAPRFIVEAMGVILIAILALYISGQPQGLVAAIPTIGALALGAQRLLPLVQQGYLGWSQMVGSGQIMIDVLSLLNEPVMRSLPPPAESDRQPFSRSIEIDQLGFVYAGNRRPALRGVSVTIAKGQRVGFVGKTGSGKSTLFDLVMGLLDPSSGRILIDGVPLTDENRVAWQGQIAHVPQAIYLSDSSIAANIAFGQPAASIDMERVRAAGRAAEIDEFVMGLPDGYATDVGERGVRLSGGQRQRMGIARALYKNAQVLVLDEATSALDDRTEAAVMESVSRLGRDMTILIIAHRITTLAGCDLIVRMEEGRVVQTGTYAEIIESGLPSPQRALNQS